MEEIYYKKKLENVTNAELEDDFDNLDMVFEDHPPEIWEHLERVFTNPNYNGPSKEIVFNYIRDNLQNHSASTRRRLNQGGRRLRKTGRSIKSRRGRKSKKSRKSKKTRRRK